MDKRLYFEDFTAGQVYSLGAHRITAEEIIDFAREFDPQPQHLDPEAAKASILRGLAASGWHLSALAMRMIVDGLFSRTASMGHDTLATVDGILESGLSFDFPQGTE